MDPIKSNLLRVSTEDMENIDENGDILNHDSYETTPVEKIIKLETEANFSESELEYFAKNSLFIFSEKNKFRKMMQTMVRKKQFVWFINVIILLNSVFLILDTVESLNDISDYSNYFFTAIFTFEMVVKIIAYGFVLGDFTYLRDAWNCLDFIIVVTGLIDLMPEYNSNLLALRSFRLIRPLKTISILPNMRVFISTIVNSLIDLSSVFMLLIFFFFIFSILALSLWNDRFDYLCRTTINPINGSFYPDTNFKNKLCGGENTCGNNSSLCLSANEFFNNGSYFFSPNYNRLDETNYRELNWGITNFENIANSLWVVFQTTTGEGWSDIMYILMDGHNYYVSFIFFLLCLVFNYFFLLNLLIAVLLYNFEKNRAWDDPRRMQLIPDKKEQNKMKLKNNLSDSKFKTYNKLLNEESALKKYRRKYRPIKETDTNKAADVKNLRSIMHRFTKVRCFERIKRTSDYHKNFIFGYYCYYVYKQPIIQYIFYGCIVINSILLCLTRVDQSDFEYSALEKVNICMVSFFTLEIFLLLFGLGFKKFSRDFMNIWDFIVVTISLIEILILRNVMTNRTTSVASTFRMLRVLRIFKLIRSWQNFQVIIASIKETLIRMADFFLLLALFLLIFTLLGCNFFKYSLKFDESDKFSRTSQSNFYNFDDFLSSFISVFQILIGDGWHKFFYDCFRSSSNSRVTVVIFFFFIVLIGQFTLLNIFLAYLIDNFERARRHLYKNIKVKTFIDNLIYYSSKQHEYDNIDWNSKVSKISFFNFIAQKLDNKKLLSEGRFIIAAKSELDFFFFKKKKTEVYAQNKSQNDNGRIIFFDNWFHPDYSNNKTNSLDQFHYFEEFFEDCDKKYEKFDTKKKLTTTSFFDIIKQNKNTIEEPDINYTEKERKNKTSQIRLNRSQENLLSFKLEISNADLNSSKVSQKSNPRNSKSKFLEVNDYNTNHIFKLESNKQCPTVNILTEDGMAPASKDENFEVLGNMMRKNAHYIVHEESHSERIERKDSILKVKKGSPRTSVAAIVNSNKNTGSKKISFLKSEVYEDYKNNIERTKSQVQELSRKKLQEMITHEDNSIDQNKVNSSENASLTIVAHSNTQYEKKQERLNSQPDSALKRRDIVSKIKKKMTNRKEKEEKEKKVEEKRSKNSCYICFRKISNYFKSINEYISKSSLGIFHKELLFRKFLKRIVEHFVFDLVISIVILINCVILCIDSPWNDPTSKVYYIIVWFNYFFSCIFLLEALMKIIAYGFIFHSEDLVKFNRKATASNILKEAERILGEKIDVEKLKNMDIEEKKHLLKKSIKKMEKETAYLRNFSNIVDFLVVIIGLIDIIGFKSVNYLRTLRALRSIRPIRIITKNRNLKLIVTCLINSIPAMANVLLVCAVFVFIYALLGINLFKDEINFYCEDPNYITKETCILNSKNWLLNPENFSNFLVALKTLFELTLAQGWAHVMKVAAQNLQSKWVYLYFISYIVIGYLFILNLFVSVVVQKFKILKNSQENFSQLSEDEKEWIKVQKIMLKFRPVPKFEVEDSKYCNKLIHEFVLSKHFENLTVIFILLSMITLVLQYNNSSYTYNIILDSGNYFFTFLFNIEIILKIYVYGSIFFKTGWNIFDLIVILVCDVMVVLNILTYFQFVNISSISSLPILLRTFRFLRLIRLLTVYSKLRALIDTLVYLVPSVLNVGIVMAILLMIYSCIGMNLFGTVPFREEINSNNNFRNFISSLIVLFRITTGEDWHKIMNEVAYHNCTLSNFSSPTFDYFCTKYNQTCLEDEFINYTTLIDGNFSCGNNLSYFYFISFMIIGPIFILNLCVVMVIEGFSDSMYENESLLSQDYMDHFVSVWLNYDPSCKKIIPPQELVLILKELHPPLGFNYDRHHIIDAHKLFSERKKFLFIKKFLQDQNEFDRENNLKAEYELNMPQEENKIQKKNNDLSSYYLSLNKKFYTTDLEVSKLFEKFKFSAIEKEEEILKKVYSYKFISIRNLQPKNATKKKLYIHFVDACLGLSRYVVSKKNNISPDTLRNSLVGNYSKKLWNYEFEGEDLEIFFQEGGGEKKSQEINDFKEDLNEEKKVYKENPNENYEKEENENLLKNNEKEGENMNNANQMVEDNFKDSSHSNKTMNIKASNKDHSVHSNDKSISHKSFVDNLSVSAILKYNINRSSADVSSIGLQFREKSKSRFSKYSKLSKNIPSKNKGEFFLKSNKEKSLSKMNSLNNLIKSPNISELHSINQSYAFYSIDEVENIEKDYQVSEVDFEI
jgi:hypothetical protein